jgi:hypothetical protein
MGTDFIFEAKNEALHQEILGMIAAIHQRLIRIEDRITTLENNYLQSFEPTAALQRVWKDDNDNWRNEIPEGKDSLEQGNQSKTQPKN